MKLVKFTTTNNPTVSLDRTFKFTFSDSEIDRDGDRLFASGWDTTEYQQNPIVLFSHDVQKPVGRAKNVRVENDKLVGDIEFARTELADTIYQLVSGGYLKAISVGFQPVDYEFAKDRKAGVNYKRQRLLEVSIVAVPANPRALIEQPPFGKVLRDAQNAGIHVAPVVKWIADKVLDPGTTPTERLVYKDTINSMTESDPASGGFCCDNAADVECGLDDPNKCETHREMTEDEDKTLMAMTKALKNANDELKRLTETLALLKKASVVTKADDADEGDEDLKSVHLKIARMHVKMAKAFHAKAADCHDEAIKCYNMYHKDEEPDGDDDVVDKDDDPEPPDDNEEKQFARIMARAKASLL